MTLRPPDASHATPAHTLARAGSVSVVLALTAFTVACSSSPPKKAPADPHSDDRHRSEHAKRVKQAQDARGGAGSSNKAAHAKTLTIEQAERYMLELVNRDRAAHGLSALAWDERAARAGQIHSEDMARHGYTGHWGSDGLVPEERYSEVSGRDYVQENAACLADSVARELDPHSLIAPAEVEAIETAFMNERPPNDGHRKNILVPWHNHLGVGIARPAGVTNLICVSQEFSDVYGSYIPLPTSARVGELVEVSGRIDPSAKFGGVGLARIELPSARPADELNELRTYKIPQPYVTYFPKGLVTPIPVAVTGDYFTIRVPLNDQGQAGLYEVSVWARVPGNNDLVMVSLRTITVQ